MSRFYFISKLYLAAMLFFCLPFQIKAQTVIADEIPTTYEVSSTGAFSYQLPVRIPPGIQNLIPSLSITYSTQGGSGMLGVGWSITGLSAISRTVPSIYHNQSITPVDFNNDDVYTLDGQRLFEVSSGLYMTWIKNYSKIESHGTAGNGPSYFTVETTDGVIYEYGNSSHSKMVASGRQDVLIWALNKVYDRFGNYIEFDYYNNQNNGDYRITKISYTGNSNASLTPPTEIVFNYAPRSDKSKAWVSGSIVEVNDILTSIDINHNNHLVNSYSFSYDLAINRHLRTITETRPNGLQLPVVTINWGKQDIQTYTPSGIDVVMTSNNQNSIQSTFALGDYNGDGATDFVSTPILPSYGSTFGLFINNKANDFTSQTTVVGPYNSSLGITSAMNPNVHSGKMMLDFNGDGKDDLFIIVIEPIPNNSSWEYTIYYYESNGTGFEPGEIVFHYEALYNSSTANQIYASSIRSLPGDFDGDGRKDILVLVPSSLSGTVGNTFDAKVVEYTYAGPSSPVQCGTDGYLTGKFESTGSIQLRIYASVVLDYNGDGKDDLLITHDNPNIPEGLIYTIDFSYYSAGGNSYVSATPNSNLTLIYCDTYPNHNQNIYTGDFNGDGKSDLLTWMPTTTKPCVGTWDIAYSTGITNIIPFTPTGGFYFTNPSFPTSLSSIFDGWEPSWPEKYSIHIADFNGDSRDDILRLYDHNYPQTNGDITYDVFYSKGDNDFVHEPTDIISNFSARSANLVQGDFNGDGQADLLCHMSGQYPYYPSILYLHPNDISDIVTSIEHAGKRIEVETTPLSQMNDYVYNPIIGTPSGIDPHYPYLSSQMPIRVVKSLNDGMGVHNEYKYETLVHNLIGLGFMGFLKTYMIQNDAQKVVENLYYNYSDDRNPLPFLLKSYIWDLNTFNSIKLNILPPYPTTKPIIEQINWYRNEPGGLSGSVRMVVKTSTDEVNNSNGQNSSTATIINSYAPGSIFYEFGQPNAISEQNGPVSKMTTFTYDPSASFYNRKKPISVISTVQRGNKSPYAREHSFTYDNANGKISSETTDPNTSNQNTTNFSYDVFGNIHMTQIVPLNVLGNFNRYYTYGNDGRFCESEQNSYNYIKSNTFNDWGYPLSSTGVDGLTTYYSYDAVNRVVQTINPSLVVSTSTYDWANNTADNPTFQSSVPAQFSVNNSVNGISGNTTSFFDYYARKIRTVSNAFDGQKIFQDTKYYDNGLLEYSTTPYYKNNTSTKVSTSFTYDAFGRETQRVNSAGLATVNTSYNISSGLETTLSNASTGQHKTQYQDESGAIWKIDDNGNIIEYDLNSNGQPDIEKLNGNPDFETQYTYDNFGRLYTRKRPNETQSSQFIYNSLNQLVTVIDALSKSTSYSYDDLGRLIQKINSDGNYNYAYDNMPSVSTTGKLIHESSPYNTSVSYYYDALGRSIQVDQQANTQIFSTTYSYDSYDRLLARGYPSGDVVQSVYNSFGYLESLDLLSSVNGIPSQKLWKINSKNQLGAVTQSEYYSASSTTPLYVANKTYDALGYPDNKNLLKSGAGTILADWTYNFNPVNGNLQDRTDNTRALNSESFSYDPSFDRLVSNSNSNGAPTIQMDYDNVGNILKKTDVSNTIWPWRYTGFALTKVPEPQTSTPQYVIPKTTQTTSYFPFHKIKKIEEGVDKHEFTYWPNEDRAIMDYSHDPAGLVKTKYYASDYEKTVEASTGNIQETSYVIGNGELVAILYHKTGSPSTVYYPVTDYLGSITHIFDNQGIINDGLVEERSFDAWGRPRDSQTWIPLTSAPNWLIDRGFIGQEHIHLHNIINMNGRLYDPLVGRMFSPDPVVSDNTNSQAYNRYSYVNDNPLKYTDPSGNVPIGLVIAVVAAVNLAVNANNIHSIGGFYGSIAVSAASVLAGNYVGSFFYTAAGIGGFGGGFISGSTGGFAGGFVGSAGNALISGASIDESLYAGIQGAVIGGFIGGATGGLYGGARASLLGHNFFDGTGRKMCFITKEGLSGKPYNNGVASQTALREFTDKEFPFTLESLPDGSTMNMDRDIKENGWTIAKKHTYSEPGPSTILIADENFKYDLTMYESVHHEFKHAFHIADGTATKWYNEGFAKYGDAAAAEDYAWYKSEIEAYKGTIELNKSWQQFESRSIQISQFEQQIRNFEFKIKLLDFFYHR